MHVEHIVKAVVEADALDPPHEPTSGVLTGYSGTKLIGALRALGMLFGGDPSSCYLEIGVFQGLTLLSVASAVPNLPCYGIDNFAFFDAEHTNLEIVNQRRSALGVENAHLINADYEDALEHLGSHLGGRSIGVFFVDGPHDYRSQLMCLQLALPYMHDRCVILVDDSNYRHVRQANRDFLVTHPEFKLLFEAYTRCHPQNMGAAEEAAARAGWWNGVNIIVRDPDGGLDAMLPPTHRSRALYEQEHLVHGSGAAEEAHLGVAILQALDDRSPTRLARSLAGSARQLRRSRSDRSQRFPAMNTYSADLPTARLNPRATDTTLP